MASRILVVYYSRSGHTQQLAQRIAEAVGADVDAIAEHTDRSGPLGYVRSLYEALRERTPDITSSAHDPAAYSLVIVGTPIWAASPSSPVRSYLQRSHDALRSVAFFCTCGGSGGERAFAQMSRVCGQQPTTTLIVRASELGRATPAIDRFVADVQTGTSPSTPFVPGEPARPPIVR